MFWNQNPPFYSPQATPVQFVPVYPPTNNPQQPSSLKDIERYLKLVRKGMQAEEAQKKKEEEKKKSENKPKGMSFGQALFLATLSFPIITPIYVLIVAGSLKLGTMILKSMLN